MVDVEVVVTVAFVVVKLMQEYFLIAVVKFNLATDNIEAMLLTSVFVEKVCKYS